MRLGFAHEPPATMPAPHEEHGRHGWSAELALRFAARRGRTVPVDRHQLGPLLMQRPFYPEAGGVCHCYLIHPPAGIVGGDELAVAVDVDTGAHALVTTPAATRWYFSRGREARLEQQARVADGAALEWLPQETLVFDGAHARSATRVYLDGSARFCGWEIFALGRPACGDPFRSGRVDFRFELIRGGQPLLLERWRGSGALPGLRGFSACATFVATSAGEVALERARETLAAESEALCAATLMGDVLVARGLAIVCEVLTHAFTRMWRAVRPPLLGRGAVPPRIWRT